MKCNASQGVHDCVCFQRSAYKAMHSAQRCIARTIAQRTALHCAQRFTASVAQCVTLYTPPLSGGSRAQRKFAGEAERSGKRGYCAAFNESTASAATTRSASQGVRACICFQRSAYIARSAAQREALHSVHCYTSPSASLRTTLHSALYCTPPPPPALHSAQHCTAPSTTLHRAQRAKTRPIAASESSRLRKRSAQHCTAPPQRSPQLRCGMS